MAGFFFRHVCRVRHQNMGHRRLRAMGVRLARKRRETSRMRQSLLRIEAELSERVNARMFAAEQIRRRNRRMLAENARIDQLVYNRLAEIENDPFIRNALEEIRAQDFDRRNIFPNQAQPTRNGSLRRRP